MTESEWFAELETLGAELRDTLAHEQVAYVRWEPNNGTAYEMLLIPWEATTEAEQGVRTIFGDQMGPGWVWVARLHTDAVYPIRLWDEDGHLGGRVPFPDYLAEHLGKSRHSADGAALHLLLSAVAGSDPVCGLKDADILVAT